MMEKFGPYHLLRVLGRGGMGIVYVARSEAPGAPLVALKKLRADAAQVPEFRERFERECQVARSLRHPRIVRVLDSGHVDGVAYLASELVLGKDIGALAEQLSARGQTIPHQLAIRITVDVLAALAYLHEIDAPSGRSLGLVHRDIAPTNIFVGYDGVARLGDFGLAKARGASSMQLTDLGVIMGTPTYMAPEVARGEPADARTDLYGLGAVIYRLLAGRLPYEGHLHEILTALLRGGPTPPSLDVEPRLPLWFGAYVHGLMATNPRQRPVSARSAARELVAEARRYKSLATRGEVSRWLRDLFGEECTRQVQSYRRDRDFELDPLCPRSVTRAIALPPGAYPGGDETVVGPLTGEEPVIVAAPKPAMAREAHLPTGPVGLPSVPIATRYLERLYSVFRPLRRLGRAAASIFRCHASWREEPVQKTASCFGRLNDEHRTRPGLRP
ncbi:MAG: serine/threonine-protein kinase [Myxococcota bacterium]